MDRSSPPVIGFRLATRSPAVRLLLLVVFFARASERELSAALVLLCRKFQASLDDRVVRPPERAVTLLVDDEAALVHAIGEFLSECGFIVLDAFSSQDALALAPEYPTGIDVPVSDVVMLGIRGPDLHRQIVEFSTQNSGPLHVRLRGRPSRYEVAS
jgi:hypothetical protein